MVKFYKIVLINFLFVLFGMAGTTTFGMNAPKDLKGYYKTLGIFVDATQEQIKRAYKVLTKRWHPDRNLENREEAIEKMKQINIAYSVLEDPTKRKEYDEGKLQPTSGAPEKSELMEFQIQNRIIFWQNSWDKGIYNAFNLAKVKNIQEFNKAIYDSFEKFIHEARTMHDVNAYGIMLAAYKGMLRVYGNLLNKLVNSDSLKDASEVVQAIFDIQKTFKNDYFMYKRSEKDYNASLTEIHKIFEIICTSINQLSQEMIKIPRQASVAIITEANKKFIAKSYSLEKVLEEYERGWNTLKVVEPYSYGVMFDYYCNLLDLLINNKNENAALIYNKINKGFVEKVYQYERAYLGGDFERIAGNRARDLLKYAAEIRENFHKWDVIEKKIDKFDIEKEKEAQLSPHLLQKFTQRLKNLASVLSLK